MPVFGVPSQRRSTKVEKYATPVATSVIAEEKKARSIMFNEAAVEALALPEDNAQVAFSFEDGIFVFNANDPNIPEEYKINVTKLDPRKISDKKTYEYMMKKLELDDQVENEFDLVATTVDGLAAFELKVKSVGGDVADVASETEGSDVIVGKQEAAIDEFRPAQASGTETIDADPFTSTAQNVTVD